jgi:hypothetical protein
MHNNDQPSYFCGGIAPFGYPVFPGAPCPTPAEFYVWPENFPYGYVCAAHLAELRRRGCPIYQVTEIATQRVVFQRGIINATGGNP